MSVYQSQVPSFLARFFHSFPHLNVTAHKVNSTFDYHNQVYLESLGILASFPALILILILVILLIYLLTRCCDRHAKRDRSFVCLKVILALLGKATWAAIGLGLYGNDDFHSGIETVVESLKNIRDHFFGLSEQTLTVKLSIEEALPPLLLQLRSTMGRPVPENMDREISYIKGNASKTLGQIIHLNKDFSAISSQMGLYHTIQFYESIRWPINITLLIIFIFFCLVLFYAIVRHSRCCFITFSVVGLIAVILNWSLVSLYLVGSVSLADICVNPTRATITELTGQNISPKISDFYMHCQPLQRETTGLFKDSLKEAEEAIMYAQQALREINTKLEQREQAAATIESLFDLLYRVEDGITNHIQFRTDCQTIHAFWTKAVDGLCNTTLYGLSLLLLSSILTAFLFTLLVGLDSHTWIYIQKRKQCMGNGAEECVSFLPSAPSYGDRTGTAGRRTGGAGLNPYLINQTRHEWSCSPALEDNVPTPLNGTSRKNDHGSLHYPHQGRLHETGTLGHSVLGPNNGQYATLSKQCKTLEANDFY